MGVDVRTIFLCAQIQMEVSKAYRAIESPQRLSLNAVSHRHGPKADDSSSDCFY